VVPGIGTDDLYTIECGIDERGFGMVWDKSIVDLEILDGELYASVGLNYPDGARIWKTSDGMKWIPTSEYSFGVFHGSDPNGDPTDFCLVPGTEGRNGDPVSSSVTNFGKSDVTGTETLFTGGTGTSGCNGRGARVARLDGDEWTLIVDYFVDDNDEGTNENGFGVADSFPTSNFQAWSWVEYDDLLFVSVIRLKNGSRIMYTDSGSEDDGAWSYSVGGDSTELGDGFGDVTNIGSHLYVFDSTFYAGTISNVGFNTDSTTNGADIWRGTGSGKRLTWTPVTQDGFGDASIAQFEAFTTFDGMLYVAGSNITASGFVGDQEDGYSGAKIFRLVSSGKCFIATAAFGSSLADEVVTLRDFRDTVLAENGLGRTIVKLYYKLSPPMAKYIAGNEPLKVTARVVLTPLVYAVKYPLLAVLVLTLGGFLVIRRRLFSHCWNK
jgi:hypothetical protein